MAIMKGLFSNVLVPVAMDAEGNILVSATNPTSESLTGIVSGTPKGFSYMNPGDSITYLPTSAGSATLYYSNDDVTLCEADIAANHITSSNTAEWTASSYGAVTAKTQEIVAGKLTAIVLVATSGTWKLMVGR